MPAYCAFQVQKQTLCPMAAVSHTKGRALASGSANDEIRQCTQCPDVAGFPAQAWLNTQAKQPGSGWLLSF